MHRLFLSGWGMFLELRRPSASSHQGIGPETLTSTGQRVAAARSMSLSKCSGHVLLACKPWLTETCFPQPGTLFSSFLIIIFYQYCCTVKWGSWFSYQFTFLKDLAEVSNTALKCVVGHTVYKYIEFYLRRLMFTFEIGPRLKASLGLIHPEWISCLPQHRLVTDSDTFWGRQPQATTTRKDRGVKRLNEETGTVPISSQLLVLPLGWWEITWDPKDLKLTKLCHPVSHCCSCRLTC